jgi:general secretion pathway protein M
VIAVREWYFTRSAREQRLILLMLAIALPLLGWLLVIQPLSRTYDRSLERHLEAIDRNGRVQLLAERGRTSPKQQAAPGVEIGLAVAEAASRAGLSLDSNSAAGPNAVTISIAQAPSTAALQWLHALEGEGIRIEEVRITPAGDSGASVTARLARVPL